MLIIRAIAFVVLSAFSGGLVSAQSALPDAPRPNREASGQDEQVLGRAVGPSQPEETKNNPQPAEAPQASADADPSKDASEGKQPKRILWIIPNYRAVSANTQLPPLSVKGKFWLATQDSFDYSSFVLAGIVAGIVFRGHY